MRCEQTSCQACKRLVEGQGRSNLDFFFGCGSSVLGIEFQVHARACECVIMGSEILQVLGNQSQESENQPSDNVAPPPSWACPVNGLKSSYPLPPPNLQ